MVNNHHGHQLQFFKNFDFLSEYFFMKMTQQNWFAVFPTQRTSRNQIFSIFNHVLSWVLSVMNIMGKFLGTLFYIAPQLEWRSVVHLKTSLNYMWCQGEACVCIGRNSVFCSAKFSFPVSWFSLQNLSFFG